MLRIESIIAVKFWSATWRRLSLRISPWSRCETPQRLWKNFRKIYNLFTWNFREMFYRSLIEVPVLTDMIFLFEVLTNELLLTELLIHSSTYCLTESLAWFTNCRPVILTPPWGNISSKPTSFIIWNKDNKMYDSLKSWFQIRYSRWKVSESEPRSTTKLINMHKDPQDSCC